MAVASPFCMAKKVQPGLGGQPTRTARDGSVRTERQWRGIGGGPPSKRCSSARVRSSESPALTDTRSSCPDGWTGEEGGYTTVTATSLAVQSSGRQPAECCWSVRHWNGGGPALPLQLGGGEVTPVMRMDGQVRSSLTFLLRRADEVVLVLVLVLDATRCRAVSGMRFAAAGAEVCEWL